jgi:hypothetical protein
MSTCFFFVCNKQLSGGKWQFRNTASEDQTSPSSSLRLMPPPLIGEALAEDSFFAKIACGSKGIFCRKAKHQQSRPQYKPEGSTLLAPLQFL